MILTYSQNLRKCFINVPQDSELRLTSTIGRDSISDFSDFLETDSWQEF